MIDEMLEKIYMKYEFVYRIKLIKENDKNYIKCFVYDRENFKIVGYARNIELIESHEYLDDRIRGLLSFESELLAIDVAESDFFNIWLNRLMKYYDSEDEEIFIQKIGIYVIKYSFSSKYIIYAKERNEETGKHEDVIVADNVTYEEIEEFIREKDITHI